MAKRGENIRKRKDGRWEGRYKLSCENGTKICSVYGKTYNECKEKLLSCKLKSNETMGFNNCKEKTFEEVLRLWLISNRVKNKGATEHKYIFMVEKHIIPELGNHKISEINSVIINRFLDNKLLCGNLRNSQKLSPSYVRTLSVIINSAIKFAANEGLCSDCKLSINKPKPEKKEIEILTRKQQSELEHLLIKDIDNIKLGTIIALYTGIRIGELCSLTWEDVDLSNKIIHIRHTVSRVTENGKTKLIIDEPKTASSKRDVPISSFLFSILKKMKQTAISDYVVSSKKEFMSTRTFDYKYKNMLKDFGLPKTNFHVLRHTFATRCVEVGVDIKTLSELLGHSNASITLNVYVHSSMEIKRMQIEKLYSEHVA